MKRIIQAASFRLIEVALTQEQFDKWDSKRKAAYLREHPNSKFGKKPREATKKTNTREATKKTNTRVKLDAKGKKKIVDDMRNLRNSDDATPQDVKKYISGLANLAGDNHAKVLNTQLEACRKMVLQVEDADKLRRSTYRGSFMSDSNSTEYKQALKYQDIDIDHHDKEQRLNRLVEDAQATLSDALKRVGFDSKLYRRQLSILIWQAISNEEST